ncbi:hypothetical protein CEE37_03980 [candidate division LCP-89 bacterium B3_LCP]|uniref:Uncharacterized protein n=1 Tax=candidate division LCP-89 bacterium B3_LCP TaxID=2012998 RepID=A0A532V3E1_UNCL8|nr:MAG: hypothetical protein CEE37_03980 [candidate division LCP-89 bacterium B3_LCP]
MKIYKEQEGIDKVRIEDIIVKRFISAPSEMRKQFPTVVNSEKPIWRAIRTELYVLLVFISDEEKERIDNLIFKKYFPFPGLISSDTSVKAAFKLEGAKKIYIRDCTVNEMYSLTLEANSTVIIQNLEQTVKTIDLDIQRYTLELAYLISFGEEINSSNMYDYIDGLIAYSIEMWKSSNSAENLNG